MARNLLQSHAWEKYVESEGQQTFWRDGDGYTVLAILNPTPLGNYLFCPYGPALSGDHPEQSLRYCLESLRTLAQEQKAFFIRVEPTVQLEPATLQKLGMVKSHDIEPAHTWVIDLTQPEETILADIEKTKVRHWRNYQKKAISLRTTQDPAEITILAQLLQGVGARDHFTPQDENHLKGQLAAGFATLYLVELDGQPIAAALVYDYDGVRYYAHAATDDEHRKLMAGTILLVQMILDAKAAGAQTFDFWGITTSEDHNHPWYGFTQYKKSFGGRQVDYSGTWDLPLKKLRYRIYQAIRKLNRMRRKK